MRKITYLEAINEALDEALKRDPQVFLLGEDIGVYGGGFGGTKGLIQKYGPERIRCTPISESAIAGVAVGAAMTGKRPIIELQFSDFITIAMDQLVNQAAKIHYMYGGKATVPLVMRTPGGSGTGAGAQHSQSLESWLTHIPGLKVIQPSSAKDMKGLLLSAIEDNNPVMCFEHKLCYKQVEEVPTGYYKIPLGLADIKRKGSDVTVVATSIMVQRALDAAEILAQDGVEVEVVDPRTLVPLDRETIIESIRKTQRCLVVTEEVKQSGFGGEIAATISESKLFYSMKKPVSRLGGEFVPIPVQQQLEHHAVPQVHDIVKELRNLMEP